jgi:hypothetical protein
MVQQLDADNSSRVTTDLDLVKVMLTFKQFIFWVKQLLHITDTLSHMRFKLINVF